MQTLKSVLKSRYISLLGRVQEMKVVVLEIHFKTNNVSKTGYETFYNIKCMYFLKTKRRK